MGKDTNNVVLYLNIFNMLNLFSGHQNQDINHPEATVIRNKNEMVERWNSLFYVRPTEERQLVTGDSRQELALVKTYT